MNTIAEPLPEQAQSSPESRSRTPILPPLLLALGRGFTLFGWAAIVLVQGIYGVTTQWGLGPALDFAALALASFLFVALFDGIATLLWKLFNFALPRLRLGRANAYLQAIPAPMLGRLVGILLMVFGDVLWPESLFKYATLALPGKVIVLAVSVAGALLFAARLMSRPATRYALMGLAAVPMVGVAVFLFHPGTDAYLAMPPAIPAVPALNLQNPGLPGPYAVRALSYGSGNSDRRPEFAAEAALITPTVDGSSIFAGYSGFAAGYHRWYNGFDFAHLPLNGLVWLPEGDGPFPLVLIVHGNHGMVEPSDPGYAYLGEHLASRGIIAVSVDENFLNGFGFADGDMAEMPLRAWLLLKHLEQWRVWNESPGTPFYGLVDLDRVGLIGHSRGGEAVAHAAEMNVRPVGAVAGASDADDFGFGIRGVVALAPCDNRYKPLGRPLRLNNADYLLLAAGHDGDMYYLDGLGQYSRATFAENPDGFKAVAYLYRGNHGNFNTVWGDADQGTFESVLLNRQPLLSAEAQQQAAKVFITGFLEASLNGRDEYRALFYNTPAARNWLPNDIIVTQYADAGFAPLATNSRGSQTALDIPGGKAEASDMTSWRNTEYRLRDGETLVPNRGLLLEWEADSAPVYLLSLPAGGAAAWELTPADALSFTLAPLGEDAERVTAPVWIEAESAGGTPARLSLKDFGPLQPPLPARLTKAEWIAAAPGYQVVVASPAERVAQVYDLPLSAFGVANPDFRPEELIAVRFLFDGTAAGGVIIDDVGFRRP
ncbi:alpha/beta hydrolase family protein [Promineifilum sp.]|uniref:alpha/beta hydrolase family protein n=1 Tax=Promineifilum sp. TaxID=2664178 RepID=UPI0035B0EBDC